MADMDDDPVFLDSDPDTRDQSALTSMRRRHHTLPERRSHTLDDTDPEEEQDLFGFGPPKRQPMPPRHLKFQYRTGSSDFQYGRGRLTKQRSVVDNDPPGSLSPKSPLTSVRSNPEVEPVGRPRSLRMVKRSISTDTGLSLCSLSSLVQFKVSGARDGEIISEK